MVQTKTATTTIPIGVIASSSNGPLVEFGPADGMTAGKRNQKESETAIGYRFSSVAAPLVYWYVNTMYTELKLYGYTKKKHSPQKLTSFYFFHEATPMTTLSDERKVK